MPTSSNNSRRKSIAVDPTGENGPVNRDSSVRFGAGVGGKRRESLPASAIPNKNFSNTNDNNNNNNNNAFTPGKKSKTRKSSGGDDNIVWDYHLRNALPSTAQKKRKTPSLKERGHNNNRLHPGDMDGGRISHESKRSKTDDSSVSNSNNALNDTFNMGANTADINSVLYATSGDVNESMMSMESKNSIASSSASTESDILNVTTLSDTHEYTASSFIQATKFRNVLDERAKSLFAEATKRKEEEAQVANHEEPSATLELEDLTLNLDGDLTQSSTQNVGKLLSGMAQKENVAQTAIQEEEEEDEDDEIEFTSHQKSRTPRKSDVSVMTKASEDETKSVGDLDELLAESESFIEEDERQSSFVESTASENQLNSILGDNPSMTGNNITKSSPVILKNMGGDMSKIHKLTASLKKENKQMHQKSHTPRKSDVSVMTKASEDETKSVGDLDELLAESESFIEEDERQSSFVESTVSENQLNSILGDSPSMAGNNITKSSPMSLCPSPSFVTGKKARSSPIILKNMGGNISKIHKLTASLKKENKQKRMSLPIVGASNPLRPKMRFSVDPPGAMNETPASPEPAKRSDMTDSPARNTRNAKKSPAADSPARNTRNARKAQLSPIPTVDSPARNTRSAKKKNSPSPARKSSAADSPARNKRRAKKSNSPSPARSLFKDPTNSEEKKRESEVSEPSGDLSAEYPFLSLDDDPPTNAGDTLSYSDGEGTQTAVFNEFNDLLNEDSGEIEFTSRQSAKKKKKRRETAETADLAGLLTEIPSDDEGELSRTTPRASTINTPKSILNSSSKKSNKKSVAFRSPKAAEYNIESPSVSMTPMHPKSVRDRWAVPSQVDEKTTELEGGIAELLAARGSNNSDGMDAMDQSVEKTTELESKLDVLLENKDEESVFSLPSVSIELSRDSSKDDMSMVEPTQTIALEGNLASIADVHQRSGNNLPAETTETINIENTINSLVRKAGGEETVEDVTLPSLPDATQTVDIDRSMGSVLRAAEQHAPRGSTEPTQTVELNPDLNDLLKEAGSSHHHSDSIEFSSKHVSGEDDTVSELGMKGMTSHELQNNQEVRRGLEKIVESTPPQPVDITLDEIVAKGGIALGHLTQFEEDVVVNALSVAMEASSISMVTEESDKILSSVIEQIESNDFDVEAEYNAFVQQNEELLRLIQERIRTPLDSYDMKKMLNELAKRVNAAIDVEWNDWLSQVAEVYNQELSSAILPMLEQKMATISNKVAMIDHNREQVALPMLIKSARRETRKNLKRAQAEVASCQDEVSELEAEVEEAERQLLKLQSSQQKVTQLLKSVESAHNLQCEEQDNRQSADSSYFKFFSIEKLHNWVLTRSSDSSLSLVFRGASSPYLTLSFAITDTLVVELDANMEHVPSSVQSFLSESRKKKLHPAVIGFLTNKMTLLCDDLKNIRLLSPSEIPSVIHFAELRAARIEEAAKEINTILKRCKDSFLQPSSTLKHEYEFTAFFKNSSMKRDRLRVTLSIADCYPFAPLEFHLQSSSNQFDTNSMNRQLRKIAKPGFGALTRVIDAVYTLVR